MNFINYNIQKSFMAMVVHVLTQETDVRAAATSVTELCIFGSERLNSKWLAEKFYSSKWI